MGNQHIDCCREGADRTLATLNTTDLLHHQNEIALKDVVTKPQEILALYASKAELDKGEMVTLGQIQSQNQVGFLHLNSLRIEAVGQFPLHCHNFP
jgi:hypothetical protein